MAIWQEPPKPATSDPQGRVTPTQPPPPRPDATPTRPAAAPEHTPDNEMAAAANNGPNTADPADAPLHADPLLLAPERTPLVAPNQRNSWPRSAQLAVGALAAALALLLTFGGAYWLGRSTNDSSDQAGQSDNQDQVEVQGAVQSEDTDDAPNATGDQNQTDDEAPGPDDDAEQSEPSAPASVPAAPTDQAEPTDQSEPTEEPDPLDQADEAEPTTPSEPDPSNEPSDEDPSDAGPTAPAADLPFPVGEEPVRSATYRDGQVTLSGRVPTQELADEIAGKAAEVVGADNVIVDYEIDPDAPVPDSAPLYVEDYVLFDPASDEIGPDFVPILNLGIVVLTTFPDVTVTVIGHTDSIGPDDENLVLSQQRIDRILEFWTERGIPPEQMRADARGESDPIADNSTPEGRQQNRRVEFIITGLLD